MYASCNEVLNLTLIAGSIMVDKGNVAHKSRNWSSESSGNTIHEVRECHYLPRVPTISFNPCSPRIAQTAINFKSCFLRWMSCTSILKTDLGEAQIGERRVQGFGYTEPNNNVVYVPNWSLNDHLWACGAHGGESKEKYTHICQSRALPGLNTHRQSPYLMGDEFVHLMYELSGVAVRLRLHLRRLFLYSGHFLPAHPSSGVSDSFVPDFIE